MPHFRLRWGCCPPALTIPQQSCATALITVLKAMRAVLHVLLILAFVSRSGAFAPVAFSSQCLLSRRSWHGTAQVQAVPDPTDNDAAQKALEQAKQLRQEAADLEEELAKGG